MESVQSDVNPAMRSILVDWLVEVAQEYRLTSDTLFLSIAYIDRFLSLLDVKRSRLQLVGVTCMLVASKYEEIYAPQVEEFCYITDNTYTREQMLDMEAEVLNTLAFDITQPTTKTFLRRFIKAASGAYGARPPPALPRSPAPPTSFTQEMKHLAARDAAPMLPCWLPSSRPCVRDVAVLTLPAAPSAGEIPLDVTFEFLCSYLAELTLMEYGMLVHLPSQIAASVVLVALFMLGKQAWSPTLGHYSGYVPRELRHCAQAVHQLFVAAKTSGLPAARDKYGSPKFGSVSQLGTVDMLPAWLFDH